MFGYIKPVKAELKVKEWEVYQGIYCGLCKQLAQRYGFFSRMTLNYDFVFLAVLDMALEEKQIHFCKQRCMVHPFQKRTCCQSNRSMELCCDVAVMLTYHKLEDDLYDEGFWKRAAVRMIFPFAKRDYRKAAERCPQLAQKIAEQMERQRQLEQSGCSSVDRAAEPTACVMGEVFASLSDDPLRIRALQRLGYLMGRWVYLADALDDWQEDEQKHRYNPFVRENMEHPDSDIADRYRQARGTLYLTIAEMRKAYDLLGIRSLDTVLENVLDLGLKQTIDTIITKRLRENQD